MGYFRDFLYFGVEIELIAEPRNVVSHSHQTGTLSYRSFNYEILALQLRTDGCRAAHDPLTSRYRKHPEHYDKWFITSDGSLGDPTYPAIPLEAVSPVLSTESNWQKEIDRFWTSLDRVLSPLNQANCGTHIHISPGSDKCFKLNELKKIACGIVSRADNLNEILPRSRQNNANCVKNWEVGTLGACKGTSSMKDIWATIWALPNEEKLRDFMQNDRRMMWNFEHTVPGTTRYTGTIEFRGGPGLRSSIKTKWWIAVVLSLIKMWLCLDTDQRYIPLDTNTFWRLIKDFACSISVQEDLPPDWRDLNESS